MKRWLIHPFMASLFIIQFSFFGWLVWITYFRPLVMESRLSGDPEDLEEVLYETREDSLRGHFHNVDETINIERQNTSLCLKCHGTYPHSKARDVRSFLNAHAFFMACEVCHIRRDRGQVVVYKWIKAGTGEELQVLDGPPGNYGGIIVPFLREKGHLKRLDQALNRKAILKYIESRNSLTADEAAELKLRIHKKISSRPVFCDECHRKKGYLDFEKLLYPPHRIEILTSTEVVGMIKKYKEFYLPTMFDPEMIMMNRFNHKGQGRP